jgi:hypothetical protein
MRWTLIFALLAAPALAGGSGWSYFTPYQADPAAALDKLRWEVFRGGKYYKLFPRKKAKSPNHALSLGEDEGTHSIIDIVKVGAAPCNPGQACPLPAAELTRLFGTTKPARAQVEARERDLEGLWDRWIGLYIVVYEGDTPKWLYFGGRSGD